MSNLEENAFIPIKNPSKMVLKIDEAISDAELKEERENEIYSELPPKTKKSFSNVVMQKIDLQKIADEVNTLYQDGFDYHEEDEVHIPYLRTLRTRPLELDDPMIKSDHQNSNTTVRLGNFQILDDENFVVNHLGERLLTLDDAPTKEGRNR